MCIVCMADNSHAMSCLFNLKIIIIKKYFKMSSATVVTGPLWVEGTDLVKNSQDVSTAFNDVPISLIVLISALAAGGLSRWFVSLFKCSR